MKAIHLFCLFLVCILTSCFLTDEICLFEESKAVFKTENLRDGFTGFEYNEQIILDIENDSESNFLYVFDLLGTLPIGMSYIMQDNIITLQGTPKETGDFELNINVEATPITDKDDGCTDPTSISKSFNLRIRAF